MRKAKISMVMYGILPDRMSLSARNGWIDDQGRVYIYYTIEEVSKEMNCADPNPDPESSKL